MKKLFVLILVFVLAVSMTVLPAVAVPGSSVAEEGKARINLEGLQKLAGGNAKQLNVSWNEEKGIPRFISGKLSTQAIKSTEAALSFMDENKELFKVRNSKFMLKSNHKDELGMIHYRMGVSSDGIPVYGRELVLHSDSNGNIYAINGDAAADVPDRAWKKSVRLSAQKAIETAAASLDFKPDKNTYTADPEAELYINDFDGVWQPVYLVRLQFINPYPGDMRIFVNAADGKIVQKSNEVRYLSATGSGTGCYSGTGSLNLDYSNGVYYTRDFTYPTCVYTYTAQHSTNSSYFTIVSDSDGNFNDSNQAAAVDVHRYMRTVCEYFRNNFMRYGYDNSNSICKNVVHYGVNCNAAFWNGSMFVVGDGDGLKYKPFCSLDAMAHEFTHALIEYTARLIYTGQPGALDESFSDCFACLIDDEDWLIGEDIVTSSYGMAAISNVANPSACGSAEHMRDYVDSADQAYISVNAGIPNKAFYNIATSIGRSKAGFIYYRALRDYMTSTTQFTDVRDDLLQSAADIYGVDSYEFSAVGNGFASVGIGEPIADPLGRFEPNDRISSAHGPLNKLATYKTYISSSVDLDYYYIDLYSGTYTVILDGLPADYDLYLYDSAGKMVAYSSNSGNTTEAITYTADVSGDYPARYYIKVMGYVGASNKSAPYTLHFTYSR